MSRPIHTPKLTAKTLCLTCKSSTITQGRQENHYIILCDIHKENIPFDVVECSGYVHKNTTSLWDMQQIAWPVMTDKKGHLIGFKSPKEAERLIKSDKADLGGTVTDDW